MKLGLASFAFTLVLLSCTPAEQQQAKLVEQRVDVVLERALTVEEQICLAAAYVPGVAGADAKIICGTVDVAGRAADVFLQAIDGQRAKLGDAGPRDSGPQ